MRHNNRRKGKRRKRCGGLHFAQGLLLEIFGLLVLLAAVGSLGRSYWASSGKNQVTSAHPSGFGGSTTFDLANWFRQERN